MNAEQAINYLRSLWRAANGDGELGSVVLLADGYHTLISLLEVTRDLAPDLDSSWKMTEEEQAAAVARVREREEYNRKYPTLDW